MDQPGSSMSTPRARDPARESGRGLVSPFTRLVGLSTRRHRVLSIVGVFLCGRRAAPFPPFVADGPFRDSEYCGDITCWSIRLEPPRVPFRILACSFPLAFTSPCLFSITVLYFVGTTSLRVLPR